MSKLIKFTVGKIYSIRMGFDFYNRYANHAYQETPIKIEKTGEYILPPNKIFCGDTLERILTLPVDTRSWIINYELEFADKRGILVYLNEKNIIEGEKIHYRIQNITENPILVRFDEVIFTLDMPDKAEEWQELETEREIYNPLLGKKRKKKDIIL